MKKIIIACIFISQILPVSAQFLEEFYEDQLAGFSVYYARNSSNSQAHTFGKDNNNEFKKTGSWPSIYIDVSMYDADKFGFGWDFKSKLFGDLWVFLFRAIQDLNNESNVNEYSPMVSSWVENNFTVNFFTRDKIIIAGGLAFNLYQLAVYDSYKNGYAEYGTGNCAPLTLGPCVRVDKTLTDWLAIRLRASYSYPLVNLNAQDAKKPVIFSLNPELFTRFGLFFGTEYLAFLGNESNKDQSGQSTFNASRLDLVLGFRFR